MNIIAMKHFPNLWRGMALLPLLLSCGESQDGAHRGEANQTAQQEEGTKGQTDAVFLTHRQFEALKMKVDTLAQRNMANYVEASGELHLPPQNDAIVTTVVGGNLVDIPVLIGNAVKKGTPLAYLAHPDIVQIQSDYLEAHTEAEFLEREYQRQQRLYRNGVGSGMNFQRAEANYKAAQGKRRALAAQLRQLGLSAAEVAAGNISNKLALRSPIDGHVQDIMAKLGQYVAPQTPVFNVVNTDHVHIDLTVYEKDAHRVAVGQTVRFTVPSQSNAEGTSEIYNISKAFDQNPRAVHVHAEIPHSDMALIPGSYVRAQIEVGNTKNTALPTDAVINDAGRHLVFMGEQDKNGWRFVPVEVIVEQEGRNWTGVRFLEAPPKNALFAQNSAYYLSAELNKENAAHDH
ncbi:efflux RND transporter periplasmic adaptor subunit [Maribacter sp. 2307ULW6-5]|uniref:efflux RND transporter periplasmic adaptor subunit n=1 Tax=Maribacter sp. 2307ULW6-5 TaxID=3386275 RepID=UPI0039BC6AC3